MHMKICPNIVLIIIVQNNFFVNNDLSMPFFGKHNQVTLCVYIIL